MSIAYRASAGGTLATAGGRLAVTIPPETVGQDGMLMGVTISADLPALAGWDLRRKIITSNGTTRTHVYSRVAKPDDAGTLVTLLDPAPPGVERGAVGLGVWSGTDPGDPVRAIVSTSDAVNHATHVSPTVVTDMDGCWLVEIVCSQSPNSNNITAWTKPAELTARRIVYSGATAGQSQREVAIGDNAAAIADLTEVGGYTWTADVPSPNTALYGVLLAPATGVQTVHPASDITPWPSITPTLPSGLAQAAYLNDGRDSTYVETGTGPVAVVGEWALSMTVPPGADEDMILTIRCRDTSASSVTRLIELRQGATVISSSIDSTVRATWTDVQVTVPAEDLAAVTDWSALRVRVTQTAA
ncbi:hypothetical protein [Actinomadura sp. 3N508]|uniref:hypothetical protein n=1 Tax=Actinomadura sp. 3N508 TaxID=3375153 RepID=UPI0037BCF50A